jgi:hypothetical protein
LQIPVTGTFTRLESFTTTLIHGVGVGVGVATIKVTVLPPVVQEFQGQT